MIRSFAKSLEETVGIDEAAGYVALVGSELGNWIENQYKQSADKERFEPDELARLLVDLKDRIGGDFHIVSVDDEKIVLGNNACPFAELAEGRPSLCRMTSNVFGRITANQLGYARVDLPETIAKGDGHCKVVINLKPNGIPGDEDHEFFRVDDDLV